MRTLPAVVVLAVCLVLAASCKSTNSSETVESQRPAEVTTAAWQTESGEQDPAVKPVAPDSAKLEDLEEENRRLKDELAKAHSDRAWEGKTQPADPVVPEAVTPKLTVDSVKASLREQGVSSLAVSKNPAGEIYVVLPGGMAFGSGKADLKNEAKVALRGLAKAVREDYADLSIRVEGHTDSDPIKRSKWESNEVLSTARAQSVAVFFVRDCDLPGSRLQTRGFGAARPVASNTTSEGKARNRRVEIVLVN